MNKIILFFMMICSSSLCAEAVATVLYANNKVTANRNGAERTLARGAQLEAGDAVITAAGAVVNIKYLNGTLVNLGENSNYKILSYSPDAKDVQIKAELNSGKLHFQTTGKVKESLKTPVIALAILGTDAKVYVASKTQTYIAVGSGHVQAGNNKPLSAGDSIVANPQGVQNATFPAAGQINSPKGAPGTISAANERRAEGGSQTTKTENSTTKSSATAAKTEQGNKKQERVARSEQSSKAKKNSNTQKKKTASRSTTSNKAKRSEGTIATSSTDTAANATANIGTIISASQTVGNTTTGAIAATTANLALITAFC